MIYLMFFAYVMTARFAGIMPVIYFQVWIQMRPLFRWAGSKKKLLPQIKKYLPHTYSRYFEPFCGSACLFFDTLPQKAVLSDMNAELIHTYLMVKEAPSKVYDFLQGLDVSQDEYKRVRNLDEHALEDYQRAGRFIYLNKLCFNGVYRTNLQGRFNVPMGIKTGSIPKLSDLELYSEHLRDVEFFARDFESVVNMANKDDFVYLDPPYSKPDSRKRGEYGPNSFDYGDIERLVNVLISANKRGVPFVLSYCESDILLSAIPSEWSVEHLSVRRHVAGFHQHRRMVGELLISNCQLAAGKL